MKELILSAFALSLILVSGIASAQTEAIDDFLGLESEIMPDLKGEQKFTPADLNEKESWNIAPDSVIKDVSRPNRGQKHSIISWNGMDPEEWLSIKNWMIERAVKDNNTEWQLRLREAGHSELFGKVLQCKGSCEVFRGANSAKVQHLSRILEGDELVTGKESVAWIYTMDGSLMRISPETSISFQEINFGRQGFFLLARLNHGHVFWSPVSYQPLEMNDAPETDSFSLPLLVREANQEFYERAIQKKLDDQVEVSNVVSLSYYAVEDQVSMINRMKAKHSSHMKAGSRLMLISPNATVISKFESLDFVHLTGGHSWFKRRTSSPNGIFELHLRGYASTEVSNINNSDWHEVEPSGRTHVKVEEPRSELQILELLTKRIRTIELARQFWIRDFSIPIMRSSANPEELARNYGYKLWNNDLDKRVDFLLEYTRRIETSNLRSVQNLMTKLESNNEKPRKDLSMDMYQASLKHYLLGLKSRYDNKKMRVRDMNDLQYYVWILRNGKF